MSLGVLNNLSAMYAANNLNNTQNSLSKTLQQLSSGSKINSGADDAAGLSLVNGLMANSTALAQSQTNAQEGVGLLQVADGALSQVTNLLNRAVTLATEVSNGTLNVSQQSAADQEYQSILSEISNIGSTTTYNGTAVFGSTTQIYTSDSSSAGASIDNLSISALNKGSVGDGSGSVTSSSGQSVFIDLTKVAGTNANIGDSLVGTAGATTIAVSYVPASGGAAQTATITAGAGSAYQNTVQGLISAINNSGLNISASFGTAKQAGASVGGSVNALGDTGIIINGPVTVGAAAVGAGTVQITEGAAPVEDTQTAQVAGPVFATGTAGTATMSYTATAGINLNAAGGLTSSTAAQSVLGALNVAISNVSAQDGYIGSQINTLNSVGQVLSTQRENVVAAQNAVQATDYATAASNMSKYQILSQTGISALAQANSMSQLVTKLLQ